MPNTPDAMRTYARDKFTHKTDVLKKGANKIC